MSDTHATAPDCGDCRFWRADVTSSEMGRCHRRAPMPAVVPHAIGPHGERNSDWDLGADPVWPRTCIGEWCGEHEPGTIP